MRTLRYPTVVLAIAATLIHVCVLIAVHHRSGRLDGYAFNSLDCGEYYAIAQNVAAHGTFSQSDAPPLEPDTWRTPGYPAFLAVFIFLFGASPAALVIVQQVLSVLNVLLLFLVARHWMTDRRALIVSLLFLIEPYHLLYSTWLMATTLFTTVLLLTWHAWQRAIATCRWPWFVLTGVLCGFAVLVRPIGVLIPLVLVVGFLIHGLFGHRGTKGGKAARMSWLCIAVFAVSCLLVGGSWMLRNRLAAGRFALSDQGGVVLAYFKATEVILWSEGRTADRYRETSLDAARLDEPHPIWEAIDDQLRTLIPDLTDQQRAALSWRNLAQGNKTDVDSFAISGALAGIGRSYLLDSPLSTAGCYLARCAAILTFPLNLAIRPPTGIASNRLLDMAKGGLYLLLVLGVLVRLVRRGTRFEQVYFPLACTIALLLATTPQLDPRFRVPMVPALLAIALLPKKRAA
jgi:hypothetical protein